MSIIHLSRRYFVIHLEARAIGPHGQLSYVAGTFAMIEVMAVRFHFLHDFTRSSECRPCFNKLLQRVSSKEMKKMTQATKCYNVSMIVCASLHFGYLVYLPSFDLKTTAGLIALPVWIFIGITGPCFTALEVLAVFNIAVVTCEMMLNENIRFTSQVVQLADEGALSRSEGRKHLNLKPLIIEYQQIAVMVAEYGCVSKILLSLANVLCIPAYSVCLYASTITTESTSQLILRSAMILTDTIFCVRAYLLTSLLARMQVQSSRLYSAFASLLARRDIKLTDKITLQFICKDLVSSKNHWAVSEYSGGKVTRLDALSSIFSTVQLILLGYDFKSVFD